MGDHQAREIMEANIRRNLGVFSVPRFLCDGDPFEKPVRIDARSGFSTHSMTEWWRQNVAKEHPPTGAPAGPRRVMDAHPLHAAQWAGEPRRQKVQPPPLIFGIAPAAPTMPHYKAPFDPSRAR